MKGIDVSEFQSALDLSKVSGYGFVIIRAGYGNVISQKDKAFEYHVQNAIKAGMTIGELDLAGKYHVNIMATKKDDQLDMKIGPDTKLEGGESILVYGKDRDLQRGLNLGNKRFHSD